MIFYFSATGNSLAAAKWLADKTGDRIAPISQENAGKDWSDEKAVGFVYPTYFFGAPAFIKEFALTVQISKEAYIFLIATCGGNAGNALADVGEILEKRGFKVSLARSFAAPDNSGSLFGRKPDRSSLETFELHVKAIGTDIADRDIELADMKRSAVNSLMSRAGGPSMRVMSRRLKADSDKCKRCGICAKVCPRGNIKVTEKGAELGKDCVTCLSCVHWCPEAAIHLKGFNFTKENQYHCFGISLNDILEARKG